MTTPLLQLYSLKYNISKKVVVTRRGIIEVKVIGEMYLLYNREPALNLYHRFTESEMFFELSTGNRDS